MDVAKIQEMDRRLGKAMAAVEAKGIDAGHILHLEGKGDRVSIRWYANRHNAHAEVRELVEAFELFWQAINTA